PEQARIPTARATRPQALRRPSGSRTGDFVNNHPDGPRTLWTQIRDNLPLTPQAVERGLALERGRHPTLTELRAALGLDLELGGAWDASRRVRLPRDETLSDQQLIRFLDEMYRGLASTKLVRVELSDEGLVASRQDEKVRVRAGERLVILVLVENNRHRDGEVAIELLGARGKIAAEAKRTASVLLDAGVLEDGAGAVTLTAECEGSSVKQEIATECASSWTLTTRITDDGADEAVPARVYIDDALGAVWPDGATVRKDEHGRAFFHADGGFEALVSGEVRLLALRGLEYEPVEMTLDAPSSSRRSETVRLKRWSQMAKEGWRSADVHVHLHYGGEYLLGHEDASLVQRAEDVHFMTMMVANQGSAFVHDRAFFEGKPSELSDGDHILRWGEEYRNDLYGHLCMYGITELVPPIYSGFRLSKHPHDVPANSVAADHCHTVGGTLSYAHPLFGSGDLDRVFAQPRTVEAKELPVDVALGKIDALDVMSYPSVELETARLWYRLLNCGFRLPATAGTDTFMNLAGTGRFSNPPAGNRVFVQVEGEFTTESWCAGVRRGRTFVTNGPMLRLGVDGEGVGTEIDRPPGSEVVVEGEARSYVPIERLELVVNGEVVAHGEVKEHGKRASLSHAIRTDSSYWIAVRALGPAGPQVLGGDLFAHTSPVYVTVGGAKVERREDAAYFVEWIDRLIAMCEEHGRYASEAERKQVTQLFRTAQGLYRKIVDARPAGI
ncbi:MAG: CehA/McbA family metallohydrolase, partial [Dehalococcoidia bacterium]